RRFRPLFKIPDLPVESLEFQAVLAGAFPELQVQFAVRYPEVFVDEFLRSRIVADYRQCLESSHKPSRQRAKCPPLPMCRQSHGGLAYYFFPVTPWGSVGGSFARSRERSRQKRCRHERQRSGSSRKASGNS